MEKNPGVALAQRVFISCTYRDRAAVQFVRDWVEPALQRAGLEVWTFDPSCLEDPWLQDLGDGAAYSAVHVAVFSSEYPNSFVCMRELDLALHGYMPDEASQQLLQYQQARFQREQSPIIIPVFFNTSIPGPEEQCWQDWLSAWEQQQDARPGVDISRWAANLRDLVGREEAAVLATSANMQQATRQLVEQVVSGMYYTNMLGYDWQQATQLAAEAAVPLPGQVGVWLCCESKGGTAHVAQCTRLSTRLMVEDLVQLLSPVSSRLPQAHTQGASSSKDGAADYSIQRPFQQFVLVDLQPTGTSSQLPLKAALKSILQQLGDDAYGGLASILYPINKLTARVSSFMQDKATLMVLLNVTAQEQWDALVPKDMQKNSPGSFVIGTSPDTAAKVLSSSPTTPGGLLQGLHEVAAVVPQSWMTMVMNPTGTPEAPAVGQDDAGQQLSTAELTASAKLMTSTEIRQRLESHFAQSLAQLPPAALSMFFDCVSVLEGQTYAEVLAIDRATLGDGMLPLLAASSLVDSDPLGKLRVHDVVRELGRQYLCDPVKAQQFGFTVGSRLWLDPDGKLPAALANALKDGLTPVAVLAAKVDAATLSRLAKQRQLSEARIIIVTSSSSDSQLPVPGRHGWKSAIPFAQMRPVSPTQHEDAQVQGEPETIQPEQHQQGEAVQQPQGAVVHVQVKVQRLLESVLWLDLGCGVTDLAPWLKHAPNLIVLRVTEAKASLMSSLTAGLPRWMVRGPHYSMETLPADIGSLASLQFLDVWGCKHLSSLPDIVIGLQLQELHLQDCCSLRTLPQDLGLLSTLKVLDLNGCSSLSALPGGIGRLGGLQKLDLRNCHSLRKLPASVWNLTNLQSYMPPSGDGSTSELPDPPPRMYKLKPASQKKQTQFTLLSIDGGGMRGLIPARVLQTVEDMLKEEAWQILQDPVDSQVKRDFLARFGSVPKGVDIKGSESISVDLADFFDVISGTSTGSILAAYLATKGGYTADNILDSEEYSDGVAKFKRFMGIEAELLPGSAKAAQAMFVAAGPVIFPPHRGIKKTSLTCFGGEYCLCKHGGTGIDRVLQQSFGRDTSAIRLSSSALLSSQQGSDRPVLHTSLLVPTYYLEGNTAVAFWHGNFQSHGFSKPGWGFTTLNRLEPPDWLVKCLHVKSVAGGTHRHVPIKCTKDPKSATIATLVLHSSGDSLQVYCRPPKEGLVREGAASSSAAATVSCPPSSPRPGSPTSATSRVSSPTGHDTDAAKHRSARDQGSTPTPPTTATAIEVDGRAEVLDFQLWGVVRASSAAPTYFPAHKMAIRAPLKTADPDFRGQQWSMLDGHFVDGGVVANNPTIAGLSYLHLLHPDSNAGNTAVLSLGCGCWCDTSSTLPVACGNIRAAKPVINILMGSSCDTGVAAGELLYHTARRNLQPSGRPEDKKVNSFLRIQALARSAAEPAGHTIWDTAYIVRPNKQAHMAALHRMDEPNDWQALLQIGAELAAHHKGRIRDWVKRYLLWLPIDYSTADAEKVPDTGRSSPPLYVEPAAATRGDLSGAMAMAWVRQSTQRT